MNPRFLILAKCHLFNRIFAFFGLLNFFWDTSAINRVSTTAFDKLLIFNVLYVATPVETWRAASLQHQCRNFDTPTTIWLDKLLILNIFILLRTSRRGTPRLYSWQNRILIHPLVILIPPATTGVNYILCTAIMLPGCACALAYCRVRASVVHRQQQFLV